MAEAIVTTRRSFVTGAVGAAAIAALGTTPAIPAALDAPLIELGYEFDDAVARLNALLSDPATADDTAKVWEEIDDIVFEIAETDAGTDAGMAVKARVVRFLLPHDPQGGLMQDPDTNTALAWSLAMDVLRRAGL